MTVTPDALLTEVADLLAPLASDPPPQHWLESDCTFSYCWPCARKARWKEMLFDGDPPEQTPWYDRDEVEDAICRGIDGGEWYSGTSDTPQNCETCGCTLRFSLTRYGVEYTMEGFEAHTIAAQNLDNPDTVYELQEMLEQGAWVDDNPVLLQDLRATAEVVKALLTKKEA